MIAGGGNPSRRRPRLSRRVERGMTGRAAERKHYLDRHFPRRGKSRMEMPGKVLLARACQAKEHARYGKGVVLGCETQRLLSFGSGEGSPRNVPQASYINVTGRTAKEKTACSRVEHRPAEHKSLGGIIRLSGWCLNSPDKNTKPGAGCIVYEGLIWGKPSLLAPSLVCVGVSCGGWRYSPGAYKSVQAASGEAPMVMSVSQLQLASFSRHGL